MVGRPDCDLKAVGMVFGQFGRRVETSAQAPPPTRQWRDLENSSASPVIRQQSPSCEETGSGHDASFSLQFYVPVRDERDRLRR